jgi:hypothetical protein
MYSGVKDLAAFDSYCEALGITSIGGLKKGTGVPPDDPQIRNGATSVVLNETGNPHTHCPPLHSSLFTFDMTGHFEEVDYSDSPIYYTQDPTPIVTLDPAQEAEVTAPDLSLETTVAPIDTTLPLSSDQMDTDAADNFGFDPLLSLPALFMDNLSFSQTTVTPQVLENLTNRIIVLEARVSSYESILNNVVALRAPQRRPSPNLTPIQPVPLAQRISTRQRRATRETMNVDTSSGRRRARREVYRAQAGENPPVPRPRRHHVPNAPRQPQPHRSNPVRCHNDQCTQRFDKFRTRIDDHYGMIKSLSQRLEGVCKDLPYRSASSVPVRHREPVFTFTTPALFLSVTQRRLATVSFITAVVATTLAVYAVVITL